MCRRLVVVLFIAVIGGLGLGLFGGSVASASVSVSLEVVNEQNGQAEIPVEVSSIAIEREDVALPDTGFGNISLIFGATGLVLIGVVIVAASRRSRAM